MVKTIEYIKEHGFDALTRDFAIKVKHYPEGITLLGYCQINSPKTHPIVMECRGLILETDTLKVVCRSFDRFFNYGEAPETQAHLDMSKAVVYDKVDGSLIRIYYWKGQWHVATRGTAFAESEVNGFDLSFKELTCSALGVSPIDEPWTGVGECCSLNHLCNVFLDKDLTYIFELTSMENRVVTRYEGTTLWLLGMRENATGDYVVSHRLRNERGTEEDIIKFGALLPDKYTFDTVESCVEVAKTLPNLEEGYVVYQDGVPVCKIKSPAYVAAHHLRGEGLNPKRIAQLVLTGEEDEYLAVFPEDKVHVQPYSKALAIVKNAMELSYNCVKDIELQKDFAMAIKDSPFSSVLFTARKKGIKVGEAFEQQSDEYKIQLLLRSV